MAKKGNITSANATGVMTVSELYEQGFVLQNFATDAALAADEETLAETRMGVDGKMAAGYIPSIKPLTLTFEPFSPTVAYLDRVAARSRADMDVFEVTLSFNVPALKQVWTYKGGVLKTLKSIPDVKKVLDVRTFKFDFEGILIEDV